MFPQSLIDIWKILYHHQILFDVKIWFLRPRWREKTINATINCAFYVLFVFLCFCFALAFYSKLPTASNECTFLCHRSHNLNHDLEICCEHANTCINMCECKVYLFWCQSQRLLCLDHILYSNISYRIVSFGSIEVKLWQSKKKKLKKKSAKISNCQVILYRMTIESEFVF